MLQFIQAAISEGNNRATIGADQMIVVLLGPDYIATAAISGVYGTNKSKLGKNLQGAVDGDQSNAGVLLMHPFVYLSRSKMLLAMGKDI